jgi:hypothetical protein
MNNLKAWCHWKKKESGVTKDDLEFVKDIENLIEKNAILMEALEPFRGKKSFPRITEALEKIKLLEAGE